MPGRVAVVAPVAGTLLRVLRGSEGFIAAGTPMFELGELRALEIVIDVLSSDAARIAPGMPVRIAVDGEVARVGRVRVVEPAAFARVWALGVAVGGGRRNGARA